MTTSRTTPPAPLRTAFQRLLCERQTAHEFFNEEIPQETVERALSCAIRAPNHYLTNPWRFTILGMETRKAISKANARLVEAKRGSDAAQSKYARWMGIPNWMLVTSVRDADPVRERENYAACCCAVQNFALALHAEGISCKWTSGAVTRLDEFPKIAGYDATEESFVGLFWFGWPRKELPATRREKLESVIRYRD